MNIGPGRSRIKQPRRRQPEMHGRRRPFRRPRNGKLPVFQIGERRVTIIRSDLARFCGLANGAVLLLKISPNQKTANQ